MDRELMLAIVGLLPQVLWFALVVALIVILREPIRTEVLPRLSGFGFAGLTVSLKPAEVNRLVQARTGDPAAAPTGDALRDRAARNWRVTRGARVLWHDPDPLGNVGERAMLHDMGLFVELVRTPDEARHALGAARFDVLISNIGKNKAGEALLETLPRSAPPLVFYVRHLDPGTPAGAFAITNRPDELLHSVLDILERRPEQPA